MPRIYFDPARSRPSRGEAITRFTFGAVFGLVSLGAVWLFAPWRLPSSLGLGILLLTVVPLICGGLAAYCGDEFWERVFSRSLL
jgi:hypothetical protein